MEQATKHGLRTAIDKWVCAVQEDDALNMWISSTLVDSMCDAAWVVLRESRKTQKWMKREGIESEDK